MLLAISYVQLHVSLKVLLSVVRLQVQIHIESLKQLEELLMADVLLQVRLEVLVVIGTWIVWRVHVEFKVTLRLTSTKVVFSLEAIHGNPHPYHESPLQIGLLPPPATITPTFWLK